MPDAQTSAPESHANREEWLCVAVVAAHLGVSVRAVQKRCASGTLPARRVPGARGEVWEVEASVLTANTNANMTTNVRPQMPLPVSLEGKQKRERRTVESEREHELKDEVRFLRGIIEQLQRDGAELRAALREALKAQPKQLPQSTPESAIAAQQRAQKGDAGSRESGAGIEADGAGADELDADELLELCRRISR